ncbi:MAG: M20 family metallopeptidase [Verrucomicrobiota bacterium JB025]|nr:M20 family metallopeptidase [Verrucomicrobiota bacterium JB025]
MNALAQRVRGQVVRTSELQLAFLKRLVAMETPSGEPARTREGLELMAGELEEIGFRPRIFAGKTSGGQLVATPRSRRKREPVQMLIGHIDTVWPLGTIEEIPLVVEDRLLKGPGVFDMKAGLCNTVFALRALAALELEPPVTPVVFVNSDEEIGSHESVSRLLRLAAISERAYVMEPALGIAGKLKTARKGVGKYVITAHGVAAHAGLNPDGGASAILELSHVIQSLFALNNRDQGVSINVGQIEGGLGANVIAPRSSCQVDVRVPTARHAEEVDRAIRSLESVTPGVRLEISGGLRRPPLEPTPDSMRLWECAKAIAGELDFDLEEGMAGGGSDGCYTGQLTPTLDGLGAVGDGAHANHEHVFINQLAERTSLLALLIMAPTLTKPRKERSCKPSCAHH